MGDGSGAWLEPPSHQPQSCPGDPPSLPHHGEWERADGMVVNFSFSPRFFEALVEQVGLSQLVSKRPWHHFFAIDQRLKRYAGF